MFSNFYYFHQNKYDNRLMIFLFSEDMQIFGVDTLLI